MKLSDIFSFTSFRRTGVYRTGLLDADGTVLIQSDDKTKENAFATLLDTNPRSK